MPKEPCPMCAGTHTPQTEALLADAYCAKHMRPWPMKTALGGSFAGEAARDALMAGYAIRGAIHTCSNGEQVPMVVLMEPNQI